MKKVMVLTGVFLMTAAVGFSQERTEKKELKKAEATEVKEVKETSPRQNIQLKKAEAKPVRAAKPVAVPATEIKTEEVKRKEEE